MVRGGRGRGSERGEMHMDARKLSSAMLSSGRVGKGCTCPGQGARASFKDRKYSFPKVSMFLT